MILCPMNVMLSERKTSFSLFSLTEESVEMFVVVFKCLSMYNHVLGNAENTCRPSKASSSFF